MDITNYEKQTATITTNKYAVVEDRRLNHTYWKKMYGDNEYTAELSIEKCGEIYLLNDGQGGDAFPWGTWDLDNRDVDKYRQGLGEFESMKFDTLESVVEFLVKENLPVGEELIVDKN